MWTLIIILYGRLDGAPTVDHIDGFKSYEECNRAYQSVSGMVHNSPAHKIQSTCFLRDK